MGAHVTPIHAELFGSRTVTARGYALDSSTPVLAMCRRLLAAGVDPDTPLHCYRGKTLCLKVATIEYGAKLSVREDRGVEFCLYRPPPNGGLASPIKFDGVAA